jgi:hypothetical protein
MKKSKIIAALVLSIVFTPFVLNAQEVNYGLKGGLTISNLYIDRDELDDENSRIGMHAGLFSQFMILNTFGIQPEFIYTTKGSEASYTGVFNQKVDFRLNYIDIPVLFVLRPIEIIEFYAGPYMGFLINSNIKYSGVLSGEDELDRDHFKTIDYGLAGGVALNFGHLQAGVRYNLGLQEIADSNASRNWLGDSKNSYGQIYLGIKLND